MSLPSATLALLTFLLIVGYTTDPNPPQVQTWHRDDVSTHAPKKMEGNRAILASQLGLRTKMIGMRVAP